MTETTQPTETQQTKIEENESDLELSDVPMDEHTEHQIEPEEDEEEDESEYEVAIEEEAEYILSRLYGEIRERREQSAQLEEELEEGPEEELDEEERLRLLMDHLDPVQMSRYEYFKRTSVNRGGVKKLAYNVLNQSVSQQVAIILSGVSKVFVGEIVEKAKQVKKRYDKANLLIKLSEKKELLARMKEVSREVKEREAKNEDVSMQKQEIEAIKEALRGLDLRHVKEDGPLLPEHIREAFRLYQMENHSVPGYQWRLQGERDGMMFR